MLGHTAPKVRNVRTHNHCAAFSTKQIEARFLHQHLDSTNLLIARSCNNTAGFSTCTTTSFCAMSFDRDLKAKEKAKYDDRFQEMESEATLWLTEVLGHDLPASTNSSSSNNELCDKLHDGTVLCELANKVIPNSIRYKPRATMPFVQMENISHFLNFCSTKLAIPQHDLFQTIDLFERKNVFQVVQAIHTFSRYAVQQGGLNARFLGPKMSTSTSRTFTKEQMNEAKNHVNTYQCKFCFFFGESKARLQ